MTNKEQLDYWAANEPRKLSEWFDSEYVDAGLYVRLYDFMRDAFVRLLHIVETSLR